MANDGCDGNGEEVYWRVSLAAEVVPENREFSRMCAEPT